MDSGHSFFSNKLFFCCSILFASILFQLSCSKPKELLKVDPAYSKYIEAFSTGMVSKTSTVRIQLAADAPTTHAVGEPVKETLFEFSPAVKGTATWLDSRTIEFKPEKNLVPDQLYEINFLVGKVTTVPDAFKKFSFNIQTIKPAFTVTHTGLRSGGQKNIMRLAGEVLTADAEDAAVVEKLLTATHGGKNLKVVWEHNSDNRIHGFIITDIGRNNKDEDLQLNWNGSPLKIEDKGDAKLAVPAQGSFKVLNVMAMNDAQQYASVQFSDPVETGQDLTGLISISNSSAEQDEESNSEPSYSVNGSEVKVYIGGRLEGNCNVNVNAGIRSSWGDVLQQNFSANIVFENRLPSVKIIGKGNILPNAGKLVLPFDAVNLNAVDISIIKIYENNVPQFFQQNSLNGDNELRRVAKPIVQKTLRLDTDKALDLRRRQRFSLDIDKFLKTEPGALYRVTIGFRPEYSLFSKLSGDTTVAQNDDEEDYYNDYGNSSDGKDDDDEFWSRYDTYYPFGYSWRRRNDPTSKSYYNKERWSTRNILASNIGLTAKRGGNNEIQFAVSSILTTEPIGGVELQVLDYQLQVVGKTNSSNDGFANIQTKQKPYLLIAKKGTERGYLKLDDGSALPLSRFDIAGEEVKNGIKGFIFGERGVWRPGDSMYVNCIIEDKTGTLPKDHPVEFKLFTPQGQLYRQAVQTNEANGFYVFKTATENSAPTGNWLAKIKVGGATFDKRLKVETVMPNRLKINLDFGNEPILGNENAGKGRLNAMWLFGSPGRNLKARIEANLYARKTVFQKFAGFDFDNPATDYSTQSKTIFDGSLDDAGNAPVNTAFELEETAPGMLTANLNVKVFEPGGSFSIDNVSLPYSPYKSYAGIKMPDGEKPFDYLLAGKKHTVQLVNVDERGNLLTQGNALEIQYYRIQWRWWWDEGSNNISNFTQNQYNRLLKKDTVRLTGGRGQWTFSTSSTDWGRYLILVKDLNSNHVGGSVFYIDQAGWQSRSGNDEQSAAAMLSFTSDKEKYNVGDKISLNIPSARGGKLLVSLESGSKVLRSFWKETSQGQTKIEFDAEPTMAPNIYATVSLLQPHAQTLNDLPIRMYGSIPIFIENKNTVLQPQISMPSSLRPDEQVSVTVSEAKGKEMTYCIAIVDEGLLDLTRFKTPDPHTAFYAREALGVLSFDMFDQVIGAWGGNLERILTIGGDGDAGTTKSQTANRFKPVVKYFGPFHLNAGGKQTQTFIMPSYIGSVKTMVVAAHKGSYGFTDKVTPVKKPVMVLTTLPRVLAPGETIKLPVTVFAMENNIRQVNVSLQPNEFFEVVGDNKTTVAFDKPGDKVAYFDVRIKNATGIGKVKVMASSGGEKAEDITEIDIRNPNPVINNVQQVTLAAGQSWTGTAQPIGIASLSTGSIEISSIPSLNLQKRLNYLIEYPYGCVEQTTSAVFPQLVLHQLTDLSEFQKAEVNKNVKAGIAKLQLYQRPDGGFSYWPGITYADDWGSSYAGHFLVEALNGGHFVSDYMIQQWKNYQRGKANNWAPSSSNFYGGDLAQAYRLYTLALAKSPEIGAMNRLREFKYISPEAKWRLAAAYKLAGQENAALDLISGLNTSFGERIRPGFTFGSELRDQAMALETLTLMGKRDKASALVVTVANRLSDESWYSTQTTSYALLAIARFCGKNPSGDKIMAAVEMDGAKSDIQSAQYLRQLPLSFKNGSIPVTLTNKGTNTLYVKLITSGQPLTGDSLKPVNNPAILNMSVAYLSRNGNPVDVTKMPQGADFIAKVTLSNTGRRGAYTQMALAQVFPSGWEILNARMMDGEGAFKSSFATYQDVRDDRVYTYFDIGENQTHTYYIQLNATYPGRYYLPSSKCHAMYDNNINSSTAGKWVEVLSN